MSSNQLVWLISTFVILNAKLLDVIVETPYDNPIDIILKHQHFCLIGRIVDYSNYHTVHQSLSITRSNIRKHRAK